MISRVADHCFWFGRYVERTESTARVLGVTRQIALDSALSERQLWHPTVIVAGEEESFVKRLGDAALGDGEAVQRYMTWEDENLTCLHRSASAARENARAIRDVVSIEVWEAVNELYVWLGTPAARTEYEEHRDAFYRRVRQSTQLCLGLLRSTMLHDAPLDFIWFGVLLERTGQTARTLDVHHHALTLLGAHQVVETALWLSLLRACSGFEPFMKKNRGRVSDRGVAAFLILEPQFPRSIRYCVHSAYDRLCQIRPPAETELPGGRSLERMHALEQYLAALRPESLDPQAIHEVLTHVVDESHDVAGELGRELLGYGSPAEEAQ